MPHDAFIGIPELEGVEPIGELPQWVIPRAIEGVDNHSAWAYEFLKLVPDGDAVLDWDNRVLVYTPRHITSPHGVVEPGWYYLNAPGLTRNDFAFADKAKSIIEDTALATLGGIAAGALVGQPWVGPALGTYTFTQRIRDNPILSEMADVGFPGVRRPNEEARLARLVELAAEREQRRVAMLQSIATAAQQIDGTGSGYERNRALVELQDAIKDYTLFYGSDPAAMAAVQPYQQTLAQLWEGGQPQLPGLMTVPEGGYTGVDITVPPVLDDNYDRFGANPTQPTPSTAEPTVTPEQYFSRSYQADAPFRAANVSDAPVFTDPSVGAPYTGVEVGAPTLRDSTADLFRANTHTTPSTGQPTSAMGSGAYSALLPAFDFSQPLGVGSISPIAPVLPSVRQSSASAGTQMTPPTFASSPLAQAAMGVSSPLAQYGEVQQSTTPASGVPVTPLQFGMVPTLKSAMSAVPRTGLGAGVPATTPTLAWSPLAQPNVFDPPTRVAAKGNTGNTGNAGRRSAGKRVTASSNQIDALRDSDPMDVWVKNRTRQVEAKNAIPTATTRTRFGTTKSAPVTALPKDKNTPDEWVKRRYAELGRKTAWA